MLLDVKVCSITSLVKRHRLSGIGNGKARLYPAETALALVALRARGHSAKSANHYLAAVQQFTRWLVKAKRLATDPLEDLEPFNVEADRRRERRVLSHDELRRLVHAAYVGTITFRGLGGRDRQRSTPQPSGPGSGPRS